MNSEPLDLVDQIGALLGKLQATPLDGLSGDELLAFTSGVERLGRQVPSVQHAAVAEVNARHLAAEKRLPNTAALLVELLRIDPPEARRRVRDTELFGPRTALTGEPLPRIHAETARALADGSIDIEHARVVGTLLGRLERNTDLDVEQTEAVEQWALHAAAHTHPMSLSRWAVQAEARLNPDGTAPQENEIKQRRHVTLHPRADGTAKLTGELDHACAAALTTVLGTLSAPTPAEDGARDDRTAGQRRHDGLHAACRTLLRTGGLPSTGGASTTVLVTIKHSDLLTHLRSDGRPRPGYASTSFGQLLPITHLLRHAADTAFIPVVLNDAGGIMSYGRARRLYSPEQRRAIAARDGGCVRPGCTMPPEWCQIHHIEPWVTGGDTDVGTGAMVCDGDHEWLDRGATITMIDGVPHWTDPPWLDPQQTPRRNTANHAAPDFALPESA
jgi:hypothetical protein